MLTQKQAIRRALEDGAKISQLTALREFGCMRLADVIFKLRNDGMCIRTDWRHQNGKRFAVYRMTVPSKKNGS